MTDTLDKVLDAGLILAVIVSIGLLITVPKRQRLIREMLALKADMSLAETVAGVGYWKRAFNKTPPTWSAGMCEIFGQDPKNFSLVRCQMIWDRLGRDLAECWPHLVFRS